MGDNQSIVNWYYVRDFDSAVVDFDDYLVDAVAQILGKDRIDAETYAASNSNQIWTLLRSRIDEDKRRGLYPTFAQVTQGVKRLFWYPNHFPPCLSTRERQIRVRFKSRAPIARSIQALNDREYEALSALACKLSGAKNYCVTKKGGERGIDFLAVVPAVGRSRLLNGGTGPIRIVGQSKKHSRPIGVGSIQQFSNTLDMVRLRSDEVLDLLPTWFLREKGLIVGWFVAHNGLQSGAIQLSDKSGILYSDSWDIAEIITRSRSWQPSQGMQAPVKVINAEVKSILESSL